MFAAQNGPDTLCAFTVFAEAETLYAHAEQVLPLW
jgi:hypothetical protein